MKGPSCIPKQVHRVIISDMYVHLYLMTIKATAKFSPQAIQCDIW